MVNVLDATTLAETEREFHSGMVVGKNVNLM